MRTDNIQTLKIHKLTQAQYERELAAGNIDENALYLTPHDAAEGDGLSDAVKQYVDSKIANTKLTAVWG